MHEGEYIINGKSIRLIGVEEKRFLELCKKYTDTIIKCVECDITANPHPDPNTQSELMEFFALWHKATVKP
jgi:hypothetical protein